jgi:hypothetical protein
MASFLREGRLQKFVSDVLADKRQINDKLDGKRFLEGLQSNPDPARCVETLIGSKSGIQALRTAIRTDLSPTFMLSHSLNFFQYLSHPSIKVLGDGLLLQDIMKAIVSPPTFWNSLRKHFFEQLISGERLYTIAWLMLNIASMPSTSEVNVDEDIKDMLKQESILKCQNAKTRDLGFRIQQVLSQKQQQLSAAVTGFSGYRHNNDFANYKEIAIYPTNEEIQSTRPPFWRTATEVMVTEMKHRGSVHLDNQFRLLRADMLNELKDELKIASSHKPGRRKGLVLHGLSLHAINHGDHRRSTKCTLLFECSQGLEFVTQIQDVQKRRKFFNDNKRILSHDSFGVLRYGSQTLAFAYVNRDIDRLCQKVPVISLRLVHDKDFQVVLHGFKNNLNIEFTPVYAPVFAYEPVLRRLQEIPKLPLEKALMDPLAQDNFIPSPKLLPFLQKCESALKNDAESIVIRNIAEKKVTLDGYQLRCLVNALTSTVSLIQGPPGTGKSFIGAEIARCIHEYTEQRIVVLSYTNHALDQFLEDLIKVDIPREHIVRLGSNSKCAFNIKDLLLSEQSRRVVRSSACWAIITRLRDEMNEISDGMTPIFKKLKTFRATFEDIMDFLEFSDTDSTFAAAFTVPENDCGFSRVGSRGRAVTPSYLFDQWEAGKGPGVFSRDMNQRSSGIWDFPAQERRKKIDSWNKTIVGELIERLQEQAERLNAIQKKCEVQFVSEDVEVLSKKRIIGSTTTGAASHSTLLRAAKPDIIIVEEAGEILESHILTSLSPSVRQVILIGDHKQLRPRVNYYPLTVESGEGYDLNLSLFERLIKQGKPHTTLVEQHRMRPEISKFPRLLTYPNLRDASTTKLRPNIKGLQDAVIFIHHPNEESDDELLLDRRDMGAKKSRMNEFEAQMVLSIVKYVGQQGYGTKDIVVLTPYMGQLRRLRDLLSKENNTILSDLDSFELIRAGLQPQAAGNIGKTQLRLSTIGKHIQH